MSFDRDAAEDFIRNRDRDEALFFAGRTAELARFNAALEELRGLVERGQPPSSTFLIYQGAPGCGKTSLVNHLVKTRQDVLFVRAKTRQMEHEDALLERIHEVASASSVSHRVARQAVQLTAAALKAKHLGGTIGRDVGQFMAKRHAGAIVVYVDEAQRLNAKQHGDCLSVLHEGSFDLPVLPLFTGLSHTEDIVRSMPGLSRLSHNAVTNMGPMHEHECVESCRMMLDSFGVMGRDAERADHVCRLVARMSYGWPQHLNRAQAALCKELSRVGGELNAVNLEVVSKLSDASRHAYYRDRMAGTVLAEAPEIAASMAAALKSVVAVNRRTLTKMCRESMDHLDLDKDPDFGTKPATYVRTMIERGILAENDDGQFTLAIPSIETWPLDNHSA